jgi:hypothetical protein
VGRAQGVCLVALSLLTAHTSLAAHGRCRGEQQLRVSADNKLHGQSERLLKSALGACCCNIHPHTCMSCMHACMLLLCVLGGLPQIGAELAFAGQACAGLCRIGRLLLEQS